jgi:glycosyltransferase involved in cell wall biosynthesis
MCQLSVIIPCRNGEAYLGHALDSILSQPMAGMEIIVVDDGSTDGSAIIASSRDNSVNVIRQTAAGVSRARQAGIAAASGELLAFCDADDLWTADRLPAQVDFLRSCASHACCGLSQSFLTPELRSVGERDIMLPPEYHRTFGSLLVRRNVVEKIGKLPEDGPDLHIPFFAALQDLGIQVVRFERVVTLRRVHHENASRKGGPPFQGYARAIKGVLDRRRRSAEAAVVAKNEP